MGWLRPPRGPWLISPWSRNFLCSSSQSTDKASEYNMCKVFSRVSKVGVNFVLYPLSSIHFTSSLIAETSLFASAFGTKYWPIRCRLCWFILTSFCVISIFFTSSFLFPDGNANNWKRSGVSFPPTSSPTIDPIAEAEKNLVHLLLFLPVPGYLTLLQDVFVFVVVDGFIFRVAVVLSLTAVTVAACVVKGGVPGGAG